jgi:hypothetical protein
MNTVRLTVLALASVSFSFNLHAAAFADAIVAYEPGTGFATEFGSGLGYTNAAAALGQPNRDTGFGPVQPFNPPFERSELVSLGTNGFIVARFDTPVLNSAANSFGLDFFIYGSAGFIDVDFPNGRTDESASTFGHNLGLTRVSVSADNLTYYELNPAFAPVVDGLWPTDGSGQFGLPVDPALDRAAFANKTFDEIRQLYAGSAGGTGYDLAWAWDGQAAVALESVRYVRVDVLSGRAEIDGFAAVPEPSVSVLAVLGLAVAWATKRRTGARTLVRFGVLARRRGEAQ